MDYRLIHNKLLGNRSDKGNLEGLIKKKIVRHLETEPAHANKWRASNWDCSAKYRGHNLKANFSMKTYRTVGVKYSKKMCSDWNL